jgi:radical SAM enzyme (TIGR01210 family)
VDVHEMFAKERGQRAVKSDKPREEFPEFLTRTKPWLNAAADAEGLVSALGPEKALDALNERIGVPFFITTKRFIPEFGQVGTHGFLIVPGGCQWALKRPYPGNKKAGCGFCEFQVAIDGLVGNLVIEEDEFNALVTAGMAVFTKGADHVRFFTGGSALNPAEIPVGTMRHIATLAANSERIRTLGVESRVQFIVPETLAVYQEILKPAGKTLEVMIGFETQDDNIRLDPKTLNKGLTRKGFFKAMEAAKAAGARVAAYAILMPIKMTEREAVNECVKTIRLLAESGVDEIMLQARYSHHDWVTSPWLWSIADVLWQTQDLGPRVTLGDWRGEMPEPVVWPKNCGQCDAAVMERLDAWRNSLNPEVFNPDALPPCNCRDDWEAELNAPASP